MMITNTELVKMYKKRVSYFQVLLDSPGLIPKNARFSPHQSTQTRYGAHSAFYPMGTGRYFPGGKVAGA
jgi:hypothetical protein